MKKLVLLLIVLVVIQTGAYAEFNKKDNKQGSSSPNKYELEQNYPNPFNPETTVKYSIENENFVTLKIFNLIGQEVKTVVSENKSPGQYTVRIDASDLNSGIYFYRLTAGDFTQTKRMMVVK